MIRLYTGSGKVAYEWTKFFKDNGVVAHYDNVSWGNGYCVSAVYVEEVYEKFKNHFGIEED